MKNPILIFFVAFFTATSFAQNAPKRVEQFNLEKKVALQGFDPVSYFKQGKGLKGKKELSASYEGVVYYFSTTTNKEAFLKNPTAFEPQFGGWCAYAMGTNGEKVEVDPETFKILDGKLYLFYNAYFNNTLKSWNKDEANLKAKAETNWKKFIK
jgi:YHS domain-containing protein